MISDFLTWGVYFLVDWSYLTMILGGFWVFLGSFLLHLSVLVSVGDGKLQ